MDFEFWTSEPRIPSSCIHQLNRILQYGHHAEAEQIDLDDPHVGAVILVPLHDHTAGHRCRLERHHRIELALADHHAAGMLPEMPRQILDPSPQVREYPHARPLWRETHRSEVSLECLVRIDKLEVVHRLREPVDLFGVDRQRHADITRGAAAAVRDDIGGHGRAKAAVLLVHVLNDALATVAARQVEVDVGPFAAFLG